MEPIKVTSFAQVCKAVQETPWSVQLEFLVGEKTTLADAHEMLGHLSTEGGGHGLILNPDLLLNKQGALEFVDLKLTRLRRWKAYLDSKVAKLDEKLDVLRTVVQEGGPGARADHEAGRFRGPFPFISTDEGVADEVMPEHVTQLRALLLEASPASPAAEGFFSEGDSVSREEAEQLDTVMFNIAYLQVKRDGAALLSTHLEQGIRTLEATFVRQATHLGAESGEFSTFQEVITHAGEVVRTVGPSGI